MNHKIVARVSIFLFIFLMSQLFVCSCKKTEQPQPPPKNENSNPSVQNNEAIKPASGMVELQISLPKPLFEGTPQNISVPNLEKARAAGQKRDKFFVPEGTTNVALKKPIIGFNEEPIIGELEMITDGDKEATDGSYIELGPGLKSITIDLQNEYNIYAICVWHYHKQPRVYFDVIVQTAQDQDFITGVNTLFNNDIDNSAGLGIGTNMNYTETNEGRLIDGKGVKARYVRLYSSGNTGNELNNYIEVDVYGKPAK